MIAAFGRSNTFAEAAENAEGLQAVEPFGPSQMNEIIRHAGRNSQIYSGWKARDYVKDLIRRHKKDINPSLAKRFAQLSST